MAFAQQRDRDGRKEYLEKPGEKTAEPINQAASRLQAAETPTMAGPNCGARNPGHHAATLAGGGSEHVGAGVGEGGEAGEEEGRRGEGGEEVESEMAKRSLFFFLVRWEMGTR
jgi:hypothetical protein